MKKLIKLFLLLLIPSLTQACLWLEGTTIDGNYKTFEDKTISSMFLKMSQNTTPAKKFKYRFYRENNQTKEYLALKNISNGEYSIAIEQLLAIEKETPNLYATASNLGTAYELNGEDTLALNWIQEGIKRDNSSHHGTEWLHLLILETKIGLKNNSSLLMYHHIIELPDKFNENTIIKIGSKEYPIKKIRDALFYQLKERLIFVKPRNEIVANLLYSFAKIEEQTTTMEEAKKLLDMAKEYGFSNQKELTSITSTTTKSQISLIIKMVFYGFIALILLVLLHLFMKKRAKKKIKESLRPLDFALSINIRILLFSILSAFIFATQYPANILIFYILLVPFYMLAIHTVVKEFKARSIITDPKKSILFTLLLYIGFIFVIYFKFLQNTDSNLYYYFTAHSILALGIFYFLKLRIKN
jgi:tetratricopeptide (TPR) repeat protein